MPYLLAILAGIFTTLEAAINAKLGSIVTPKIATLHSLITGVFVILAINILKGTLSQYNAVLHVSPQWLIGGVFGMFIVFFVTKTVPKLGVTTTLTLVVGAQILSSLYLDSFILKNTAFDFLKLAGIAFLLAGVYLLVE